MVFSCPEPAHTHGDNNPSAAIRAHGYPYPHNCLGCGRKGKIVDFVAGYLGIEEKAAWAWLGQRFGFDTAYDPEASVTDALTQLWEQKRTRSKKDPNNPTVEIPASFTPALQLPITKMYLNRRGLDDESIYEWELAWDPFTQRIAIPVRDRVGNVVGFKARAIDDRQPKYLVLGDRKEHKHFGFAPYNSSSILFGLFSVCGKTLVVTEGELNTIALRQIGVHMAVGLPTAAMSEYQAQVIRGRFDKVILFLDSDEAGRKGVAIACKLLASTCDVRVVQNHDGDPLEMVRHGRPEVAIGLIENSQNYLLKLLQEETWRQALTH